MLGFKDFINYSFSLKHLKFPFSLLYLHINYVGVKCVFDKVHIVSAA